MQSPRSSARLGTILSLLGGALVIYEVFFLPIVFGSGGGSFTPTSEWTVANFGAPTVPVGLVLLALLLLSVLFVLPVVCGRGSRRVVESDGLPLFKPTKQVLQGRRWGQ